MVLLKTRIFSQYVGFATITLLAIYGALAVFQNATNAFRAEPSADGVDAPVASSAASADGTIAVEASAIAPTAPLFVNYLGTLRNAEGLALRGTYDITFRIYDDIIRRRTRLISSFASAVTDASVSCGCCPCAQSGPPVTHTQRKKWVMATKLIAR